MAGDHDHDDLDHGHLHDLLDDHHHHHGLTLSQVKTFKIIFLFVYLFISYLGLIPRVLGSCRRSKAALSFMNCFAAGVFVSIGLIHLIPEGNDQYDGWAAANGIEDAFPLYYTLTFVGILAAALIDKVIFSQHQKPVSSQPAPTKVIEMSSKQEISNTDRSDVQPDNTKPIEIDASSEQIPGAQNSKPAAILVAVALSFQVFVEGVGLGSEVEIESGAQKALSLIINSSTISLALGSAFTKANFSTRQVLIGLTCFTVVAPIAILIGFGLDDGMHTIINVILLSLATGIYIYFSCAEVIAKEFHEAEGALGKVIGMIIGLLIILGLVFIEGHSH